MISRRIQRRRASRGQALVELALFVPLVMTMVAGATDISTLLDNHLNVVYAARAGARVGAVMGVNQYADCATIGAIQAALAGNRNISVSQIIIYEADANGNPMSSGGTVLEDVYPGSASCVSTSVNTGTINVSPTVYNWIPQACPTGAPKCRDVTPFTEQSIGVEIDYTFTFQFTTLGLGSITTHDYAVMPLEVVINQTATPTPTP